MNLIAALESIEAAPDGKFRLAALVKADKACPTLRHALFMSLSPSVTTGIKKWDYLGATHFIDESTVFDSVEEWQKDIFGILALLSTRELSGQAANKAVLKHFANCRSNPLYGKWAERFIKQDLRLELGAREINKAIGEDVIPLFAVPLATDYSKIKEKDLKGQWYIQPKLDGARVIAMLPADGDKVRLLSRTGKEWGNFKPIEDVLDYYNKTRKTNNALVLDGEVVTRVDGQIDFQTLQANMMRKDGKIFGELEYVVFDACDVSEWYTPKQSYANRLNLAIEVVKEINRKSVNKINYTFLGGTSKDYLREVCEDYVSQGYEGAMLRHAEAGVENKRSKKLIKVKLFQDKEYKVWGKTEGTGKYIGTLGSLICITEDGKTFEVGSGFSDKQRMELWSLLKLPKYISVKYFEITNDGLPRFPIFRGVRHEDDFDNEVDPKVLTTKE